MAARHVTGSRWRHGPVCRAICTSSREGEVSLWRCLRCKHERRGIFGGSLYFTHEKGWSGVFCGAVSTVNMKGGGGGGDLWE